MVINPNTDNESCPLLIKCLKYSISDAEQTKLSQMIAQWQAEMPTIKFLERVGRLALKFRSNHGSR